MKLHENIKLYRDAIRSTAQQMSLKPEYVEKDYWVTYALHTIFHDEIGKDCVFKGGTALSKCFSIIERFSEDIDLVVVRREGESDGKMKTKLKAVGNLVSTVLPEVEIPGITNKMGMNRKTAHTYSKEFKGDFGQVRDVIVLESSWLGNFEPYTQKELNSYIGEMMISTGQEKLVGEYGMVPFKINVLEPIRTLCEKIMSLVRFSYGENPIDLLKLKIRHTYDLHQLLLKKEYSEFFYSEEFDKMIVRVANDDVASYRNNNQWLANHPNDAMIFRELDTIWAQLVQVYNGDFKNLVYGNLPEPEYVLGSLHQIKERLQTIDWPVKIENNDELH
jgi:hypothetical protein